MAVFINQVDTYVGRNISKIIAKSVVGATGEDAEEEEGTSQRPKYVVVGTLSHPEAEKPAWVAKIIDGSNKDLLKDVLLSCSHILYNITENASELEEASWAASLLNSEAPNYASSKIFVCLSTCLTWARTKPTDPEDTESPVGEDEYRRRRAHLNYKSHLNAEKFVIKSGKSTEGKLKTYVVAAGIPYGAGEDALHTFFKTAWHLADPAVTCYGDGSNFLPLIHVHDLAGAIVNVFDRAPATQYILGMDESRHTMMEVLQALSSTMGTGLVTCADKEAALLNPEISQEIFDLLQINIKLESGAIREFNINWVAQTGIIEAMNVVVEEYRKERGLTPMKVCLLGPPGVGKSTFAAELAKRYKIHHLHLGGIIQEAMTQLESNAKLLDQSEEEIEKLPAEIKEKAEGDKDLLSNLATQASENNGRYDEEQIISWVRAAIKAMRARNQGYVLDGFPKTQEQAKRLFESEEDPEVIDRVVFPEYVFVLNAADEFLKERVIRLPESIVTGTHNTEEGFLRRLALYRTQNTEDSTVINYFDFNEVHPFVIDVTEEGKEGEILFEMCNAMGVPHNYGPTSEEKKELEARFLAEKDERERQEKELNDRLERERLSYAAEQQAAWSAKLKEVHRQHQEVLDAEALPLRNFLMVHVMPTLVQGLMEVCKTRPGDPVDYLAEYLFRNNPQVD